MTKNPSREGTGVLPLFQNQLAVYHQILNSLRQLMRIFESGQVDDRIRVEDGQISLFPSLDQTPIGEGRVERRASWSSFGWLPPG